KPSKKSGAVDQRMPCEATAPHIIPYFALSELTGDELSVRAIEDRLASIDPLNGLLECSRLNRVLSVDGYLGNPLQKEAADLALDLHWRGKLVATYKGYDQPPLVFHERVLRCLMLHFMTRLPAHPVPVPAQIVTTRDDAAALALAATALNDHLGRQASLAAVGPTWQRNMGWVIREMALNVSADFQGRVGKARLLVEALTRHEFPAAEVATVFGVDLPAYLERLLWIHTAMLAKKDNMFSTVRESQFENLAKQDAQLAVGVLRSLGAPADQFTSSLCGDMACYDISAFDRTPFVDLGCGQFLLGSFGALTEHFQDGLREHVLRRVPKKAMGQIGRAWGHAMEDVLLGPFAEAVSSKGFLDVRVERSPHLDLAIAGPAGILIFELKSPLFRRDRVEARYDENPEPWVRTAMLGRSREEEGAIGQLRGHVERLKAGTLKVGGRAIPPTAHAHAVVVLAIPLHPAVVQRWTDELCANRDVWPWPDVRPLCLPLQEFEALIALVDANIDPFKVVRALAAGDGSASIQDVAAQRNAGLSPRAFRTAGQLAYEAALKALERAKPDDSGSTETRGERG
ncbi:MAG: hypothetical protein AAB426_04590, partial [Myxococcota bacterium]